MKTISVFGVFVADLCFIANAIPEKGQTILGSQHIVGPGGKGSNQAIAAAKLNGKVNFITKIGNDKNGEMALNLYKSLGMDIASIIQDKNHSTGVAGIMVNEKTGENAINIIPGAAGTLTHNDIEKNLYLQSLHHRNETLFHRLLVDYVRIAAIVVTISANTVIIVD